MSTHDDGRFDEVLAALAQQHDGLQPLLRTLFSFLHRRTDFFVADASPTRRIGFAPGQAERLLLQAFRAFPLKGPDGRPLAAVAAPPAGAAPAGAAPAGAAPAAGAAAVAAAGAAPPRAAAVAAAASASASASTPAPPPLLPQPQPQPQPQLLAQLPVRHSAEGRQLPIANGGVGPGYWWAQTLGDLSVSMLLDDALCASAKDVVCRLDGGGGAGAPQRLVVGLRGRPPVIDGALAAVVKASELTWSLESRAEAPRGRPVDPTGRAGRAPPGSGAIDPPAEVAAPAVAAASAAGKVLTLTLEKAVATWWRSVVEGHAEVDATAVDSTQSVSSYDDETQAAIRKIMFDEDQRRRGLPTSEEARVQQLLQRARDLPGSPLAAAPPP
jgi:hypothetical protein